MQKKQQQQQQYKDEEKEEPRKQIKKRDSKYSSNSKRNLRSNNSNNSNKDDLDGDSDEYDDGGDENEIGAMKQARKRISEINKHRREITFGGEELKKVQLEQVSDEDINNDEDDEETDYDNINRNGMVKGPDPLVRLNSQEKHMVESNMLDHRNKEMKILISQPKSNDDDNMNQQMLPQNNTTNTTENGEQISNNQLQNKYKYEPVSSSGSDIDNNNNNKHSDEMIVTPKYNKNVKIGDLTTFLDDNSLLRVLLKYLKKKTNDYKLLEFYLMAKQFYELNETCTSKEQRDHAKRIIESFFLPDSKKFIDIIQGMTRHEAMKLFVSTKKNVRLPEDLFEKSKQEVKNEMITKVFPQFMQSSRYNKLIQDGKIRPP